MKHSENRKRPSRSFWIAAAVCLCAFLGAAIFAAAHHARSEEVNMSEITLNPSSVTIGREASLQLEASFLPENARKTALVWNSGDEAVAVVDRNGLVTGKNYGTAVITVRSAENPELLTTCEIRVSNVLFVAPDGSDRSGDGSETNPFGTIEGARDAIRALPGLPESGVTVYLRAGEYNLRQTFTLTPADSGEEDRPVVYAAYPGEEVRLVSKEVITGWKKLTEAERAGNLYGMPEEARANVYAADIPAGWRFHTLYADDKKLPNARMIPSDAWESDWPKAKAGPKDYGPAGLRAKFGAGILDGLDGWEDTELKLITAIWWNVNACLTGIDSAGNTGLIQSGLTVFYPDFQSMGGQFNLMNAPKYLDEPGEWCVDSGRGRVYWWPEDGADPDAVCLFAPKLRELVRFQGDEEEAGWAKQVRYVTLRDLNFLYSDRVPETDLDPKWLTRNGESPDGMIYMQGVEHCSVEGCVLGYSGAQGIVLDHYAQNCVIEGCEIAHASSGGVYITGYGPGTTDLNKNNRIVKNHIHHVGADYMHSCAVQFFASNHNTVEYNYFHDLPYAAVSIIGMAWSQMQNGPDSIDTLNTWGGRQTMYNARWEEIDRASVRDYKTAYPYQHSENNVIEYTLCDNYMQTLRDGGALYCWCSGPDKVWQHNAGFRAFTDDWAVRAIHMDDCDGFNYIYQNLFHASGATDNSHTNGAAGGRGDGGRTDLDIWDDTVSDNVWKENIITASAYPEGYLALRAHIRKTAGGWLCKLPGAVQVSADDLLSEALLCLDADDIRVGEGTSVGEWKSKNGASAAKRNGESAGPVPVKYGNYSALRFEEGDSLSADGVPDPGKSWTVLAVSRSLADGSDRFLTVGETGLRSGQTAVEADFGSSPLRWERGAAETGFTAAGFRKEGEKLSIFADGSPVTEGTVPSGGTRGNAAAPEIGGGFQGEIAALLLFDRALTDEELGVLTDMLKNRYFTAEDPVVTWTPGEEGGTGTVTIACGTPGVSVHYTLDRSDPTADSARYDGPFAVSGPTVLKAVAVKEGWTGSRIVSRVIGVTASVPTENLLLHLDASDAAVEPGDEVSELPSRVNGYTAKQSNRGSRPVLTGNGGNLALKFDGGDMLVVRDFPSLEGHTGFTFAAVSRAEEKGAGGDEWSNRQSLMMIDETGGYGAIFIGSYQEDVRARIGIGTGNNFNSHVIRANRAERTEDFTVTVVVKDGKRQSIYADGELLISEANGTEKITNTDSTELRIGTGITGFVGEISEILIYDAALTEEEIAEVNLYLMTKYSGGN